MVDPAPFVVSADFRQNLEAMIAAEEAGDREPFRQLIENLLFLPTSERALKERDR